jgi:pimeloyl-ACP methyl ester carboxylesterase
MKQLSIFFALGFLMVSCDSAQAAMTQPSASFVVGTTHVDKYALRQAQDDTVKAQGDTVKAQGDGRPALILIPGLTDSAAVWNATVAQFAPTHTIYALTLAGFGGTKAAPAPLIDKAVADIATLIAQEHLNKPVIIGHSLGGFTAIRVAEEHGDLIRGAIAVDGLPVFPAMDKMTPAQRAAIGEQMNAQLAHITPAAFNAYERSNVVPYLTRKQNVDAVFAAGSSADPAATGQYVREMFAADLRPALASVTVPLLELAPFDSTLDPYNPQSKFTSGAEKLAYYQSLFANDKAAQVQLIENSRHFVMFDQPQAFYAAVSAFLKSLS